MPSSAEKIDDLRRQIDEIDNKLHDLLMLRADVAAQVGAVKANGGNNSELFIRPGREAVILRRLVARHHGPVPKAALVRLWRELMMDLLRVENPFVVAVYLPEGRPAHWDLARDHFGTHTPLTAYETIGQVLRAVMEGPATMGVLPFPQEDDRESWWPLLRGNEPRQPRVFARLPFGDSGSTRGPEAEALAIGRVVPESIGVDRSLLVLEAVPELSRSTVRGMMTECDLEPRILHQRLAPSDPTSTLFLAELDGAVLPSDPRFEAVAARLAGGLKNVWSLGNYAAPLTAAELANGDR
jgi:chorismate mutase-like protein